MGFEKNSNFPKILLVVSFDHFFLLKAVAISVYALIAIKWRLEETEQYFFL